MFRDESAVVYLSYFDDSGSEPTSDLCVFGGVVVNGNQVSMLETVSQFVLHSLGMPVEKFQEFKAGELYFGNGQFADCDAEKCRIAFKRLVETFVSRRLAFIYCAVSRPELERESLFGSAHPVDVAFQMCLQRLEKWAREQHPPSFTVTPSTAIIVSLDDMCVVIADECDKDVRRQLLKTFRAQRRKQNPSNPDGLFHVHDSMYFGDSVDSIGLQMADVACWTMRRILTGAPVDADIIEQLLKMSVCADVEPQWSAYRHLFRSHADVSSLPVSASDQIAPSEDQH